MERKKLDRELRDNQNEVLLKIKDSLWGKLDKGLPTNFKEFVQIVADMEHDDEP